MKAEYPAETRRDLALFQCAETTCRIIERSVPVEKYGRQPEKTQRCRTFSSSNCERNKYITMNESVKNRFSPHTTCRRRGTFFKSKFRRKSRMSTASILVSILCYVLVCEGKISSKGGPPRRTADGRVKVTAGVGHTVVLPCMVAADSPPLTSWKFGGVQISGIESRFRVGPSLRIRDVKPSDSGTYTCTATNAFGSVNCDVKLTVEDGASEKQTPTKPRFQLTAKMRRRNMVKPVNSFIRLRCRANGVPTPQIEWYKDGNLTTMPSSTSGKRKRPAWIFIIRQAQSNDSGRYRCRVWNSAGEINYTYKVRILDFVRERPRLIEPHPKNTTVQVGGMTTIQCKVNSRIKPTIKWIKRLEDKAVIAYGDDPSKKVIEIEGKHYLILPTQEMLSLPNGSYLNKLVIRRATKKHAGMYICLAANTMGYNYKYAHLKVISGPVNKSVKGAATRNKSQSRGRSQSNQGSLSLPAIIGAPAGIGLVMVVVLAWYCQRRREQNLRSEATANLMVSGSDRLSAVGSVETKSTRSSPVPQDCEHHTKDQETAQTLVGVTERQIDKNHIPPYAHRHRSPPTSGTPLLTVNEPDNLEYANIPTDDDGCYIPSAPPCSEIATSCYSGSQSNLGHRFGPPPPPPPSQKSASSVVSSYGEPATSHPPPYYYMHPPGTRRHHYPGHGHRSRPGHHHISFVQN